MRTDVSIQYDCCASALASYMVCTDSWDVINGKPIFFSGVTLKMTWLAHLEPFNDDGTWRMDTFYTTLGTGFVPTAPNATVGAGYNA